MSNRKRIKTLWVTLMPGIDTPEDEQIEELGAHGAYPRIVAALFALYERNQVETVKNVEMALAYVRWQMAEAQRVDGNHVDSAEILSLRLDYEEAQEGAE